jgi:hypothetical protein
MYEINKFRLMSFLSFCYGTATEEIESLGVSSFPIDNIPRAITVWVSDAACEQLKLYVQNINPHLSTEELIRLFYPYQLALKSEGKEIVQNSMEVCFRKNMNESFTVNRGFLYAMH